MNRGLNRIVWGVRWGVYLAAIVIAMAWGWSHPEWCAAIGAVALVQL